MGHIDLHSDEDTLTARYNPLIDRMTIRLGYVCTLTLADADEANALIDQLRDAIEAQKEHQGRELLRDEQRVRDAAEVREAL